MQLSGHELSDQPPALFSVLANRGGEHGIEIDMRIRLNLLFVGAGQREERCGALQVGSPLDPQGVQHVELVGQGQVAQP